MFFSSFSPLVRDPSVAERVLSEALRSRLAPLGADAALNLHATADQATVTVQVPGIDAATLECSVHGDELTISGRHAPSDEPTAAAGAHRTWLRRERAEGSFARTLRLPYAVDPEQTTATVSDGVLSIVLHRHQADRPRKITVAAA